MSTLSKNSNFSLFSYTNLVHAIAGGCGSAFAMTAFYPLDIVRTRHQLDYQRKVSCSTFQALKKIYKEEGIHGLYQGLIPVVQSLYCSNFVYFYAFTALKEKFNVEKSALKNLSFGILAAWVNVITTTPLWVVNTRIKVQNLKQNTTKYQNLIDGLQRIIIEEGPASLWAGTQSSLMLSVNPAIQFMIYEALKSPMSQFFKRRSLGVLATFLTGAVAKAVATVITYPLQLIQTKQRHGHNYPVRPGIFNLLAYIIRIQGVSGLYKGLEAKILQTVSTAALMFVLYEKIANAVFIVMLRDKRFTKL